MYKKKMKRIILVMVVAALLLALAGCGAKDDSPLVFGDAGWDSIQFHNGVAQFIIEHGFGYETDVMVGSTPVTFAGLRRGDIDIYMETWHDNFADAYAEAIEKEEIVVVSVNFDDNAQGLWVPTFVIKGDPAKGIEPMAPGLKSVSDLPDYWELFKDPEDPTKGRIVGSPPGWAADEILSEKMVSYSLEDTFNYFRPGSDATLAASIARAFERSEPWIGYYWDPTWVMGKFDMTLLEEPEYSDEKWLDGYSCAFPVTEVTISVHSDMTKRAPEVVEFLSNYRTSSALTSSALAYMMENDVDAADAAINFLKENEALWTGWLSSEVAAKVKAALQ
ncbi:MAG: ABC transporter substrate-binding protein [Dethiobacter sp.]|jgi:glycine betaine/proline transport system substrate-binding protein|nr:ABC transporter substrate-binding protein [Dethiobacter sp.]